LIVQTKLFSIPYLTKFLGILAKLFFSYDIHKTKILNVPAAFTVTRIYAI